MNRRQFLRGAAHLAAFPLLSAQQVPGSGGEKRTAPRLDAHAHLTSPQMSEFIRTLTNGTAVQAMFAPQGASWLVDALDRVGVERAIVLSTAYINANDLRADGGTEGSADEYRRVREENDYTAAEAARAPARLIPFASVNPKRAYAIEELARAVDRLGMRGLKVHFTNSDVRPRNPQHRDRVRTVFAYAAARNLPVVAHVSNGRLGSVAAEDIDILLSEILAPLASLRISIAHLGFKGGPVGSGLALPQAFSALAAAVGSRPPLAGRVWVDGSGVLATPMEGLGTPLAELAALVPSLRAWRADRLLFGSDGDPDATVREARGRWPLGDREWNAMAGNDGTALLGEGPRPA